MGNFEIVEETATPRKHDVLRPGFAAITYTIVREGSSPVKGFSTLESAQDYVGRMRREFEEQIAYMNRNR
jgi:hypothetical protein